MRVPIAERELNSDVPEKLEMKTACRPDLWLYTPPSGDLEGKGEMRGHDQLEFITVPLTKTHKCLDVIMCSRGM